MDKEKRNITDKKVWLDSEVQELDWVRRNRKNAKIVRAHIVGAIKHAELGAQGLYKIRIVANGGNATDVWGRMHCYDMYVLPIRGERDPLRRR